MQRSTVFLLLLSLAPPVAAFDPSPLAERPTSDGGSAAGSDAEIAVEGEVRTTDAVGEPRQWGKGRPGVWVHGAEAGGDCFNGSSNYFGLSSVAVRWGSAADACPAGTWVCRVTEVVGCDTTRPDGSVDSINCAGASLDYAATEHPGWLDRGTNNFYGRVAFEDGSPSVGHLACVTHPVWCCWE